MPSLLSACKRLFCSSLTLLFPLMVSGQALVPAGAEYCISGPLFGDQVRPHIVLSPSGGWMVWQDTSIDGQGAGIAAAPLRPDAAAITNRMRINEQLRGDQEKPRVAMLQDGTVLFAWQGWSSVLPNVYARLMTPTRIFLTPEIPMTATFPTITNQYTTNMWSWYSNRYILRTLTMSRIRQETRLGNHDPDVAGLADGTGVLVYSGIRKYSSGDTQITTSMTIQQGLPYANDVMQWVTSSGDDMEEIFMQRFGANGGKIGEEAVVNEFSPYNQRMPAVAALNNGNFVVIWVSERHFPKASGAGAWVMDLNDRTDVQISGRLFNSSGQPMSSEFRINATNAAICAEPAIGVGADGAFLVTWSQYDALNRTNTWDVYARLFGIDGRPYGAGFQVNSFTPAEQSHSQVAALGSDYLVVWSSMWQDGSLDGVYGRLVSDGVLAGNELRINSTTRNKQMQPTVAPLGDNRFLTVWTHFSGMASGFNLMAQKFGELALPAPDAPAVTPISQTSLLVNWAAVSALRNYSLYMDAGVNPVTLTNNSYEADGLNPGSTHGFRVAYTLTNSARSRLSAPGMGTTWVTAPAPGNTTTASTGNPANPGTVSGGGVTGPGGNLVLALSRNGLKLSLQWNTEAGTIYQTQVSTNLHEWKNVGAPQTGTGAVNTQDFQAEDKACFYRVIRAN